MAFKGTIPIGSSVTATLDLDATATDPATLVMAFARSGGGGSVEDGTVVNPGLSDSVSVDADARGMLSVVVDMSDQPDTGTLTITVDGATKTREPIVGDTTWEYAVDTPT